MKHMKEMRHLKERQVDHEEHEAHEGASENQAQPPRQKPGVTRVRPLFSTPNSHITQAAIGRPRAPPAVTPGLRGPS
jgi:hypothetical protein